VERTRTAARDAGVVRRLAQRLEEQGKAFKIVITACMRKLLIILNALIRDQQVWTTENFLKTV
jgi:transposase